MNPSWTIYYDDGTTFSSHDGEAFDAPAVGVVAVVQDGHQTQHGKDAWYWREGRWCGCDQWGMLDYMMNLRGPKYVIFGRTMVRDEAFWRIVRRATERSAA